MATTTTADGTNKSALRKKKIFEAIKSWGSAIILVLAIRSSVIEAFKIPSGSMIPTLMVGDQIFVNKFAYGFKLPFSDWIGDNPIYLMRRDPPQRGDVIVFKFPKDESVHYIKRVIGMPGDKIRVEDKTIFVNGKPLTRISTSRPEVINSLDSREYDKSTLALFDEPNPSTGKPHLVMIDKSNNVISNFNEITVPEDHFFVMGDNRDFSNDSRFWGFVPFRNVRGKALFVWLSLWIDFDKEQYYFRANRIGNWIN